MYDFDVQLAKGQKAEDAAYNKLKDRFENVEDLRLDKEFQSKGVDFIADNLWVEVKSDSYNTDLLFIETVSNKERGKAGWLHTCQADIILWFKPTKMVEIDWKVGKLHVVKFERFFRKCSTRTRVGNTFYTSEGLLVPIAELI